MFVLSFIDTFFFRLDPNLQNDIQKGPYKKKTPSFLISKLHKYFMNLELCILYINKYTNYLSLVTQQLIKVFGVSVQQKKEFSKTIFSTYWYKYDNRKAEIWRRRFFFFYFIFFFVIFQNLFNPILMRSIYSNVEWKFCVLTLVCWSNN